MNSFKTIVIVFSLLIFALDTNVEPSQIMVGLNGKYIKVWRFWENKNRKIDQKMFLFNPMNETIRVSVKQKVYKSEGSRFIEVKKDKKKLAGPWALKPYEYIIVDAPKKPKKQRYVFMEFFLNNEQFIWLLDFKDCPIESINVNDYSIISCDRINGGDLGFWAEYDEFIKSNADDSITIELHFKYGATKYLGGNMSGKFILKLYSSNEGKLMNAFFIDKQGEIKKKEDEIEIIIPYPRDKNESYVLQLSYSLPKVTRNTLISVDGRLYYYRNHDTEKEADLDKLSSTAISIPVIIKAKN